MSGGMTDWDHILEIRAALGMGPHAQHADVLVAIGELIGFQRGVEATRKQEVVNVAEWWDNIVRASNVTAFGRKVPTPESKP